LNVIVRGCRKTYIEQIVNKNDSNVQIVIDDEINKNIIYDKLLANRIDIERETGGLIKDYHWNKKEESRRIVFTPDKIDGGFLDQSRWNEIQNEMIRRSIIFNKILSSRLGKIP